MGFCKISTMLFIMFICLLGLCQAQNTQQDFLNTHNTPRNQVGVSNIVWNITVANYALNYANARKGDCNLVHSNGPYGENLAKGSGSFSGTAAVNLWVAEKPNYVYSSNSCVGGECLHYTQVVWSDSIQVGCARVQCTNSWWYVVCSYYPPGNYEGEYPY
ncbi:pathogenesis-related leaf protein 4-like [Humulus lupulus]|uniref:pathogenesis-related leaf protein 4-like n=1 Tax=Humulus lupulus TaxID=3486 RepID=UPI002B409519|nr:pathogenesis-related leaf protein 4-like [Humulus lupulus]